MTPTRPPRPRRSLSSGRASRTRWRGQAPAGTHTPQQYRETAEYGSRASLSLARDDSTSTRRPREGGDPYAAAISRNCGVWIPGLAHARPGRQHINTSSPRRREGTHRPQQYRETAEYGSRASLTLARDDSTSTRRPREGGDP